MVMSYCNSEVLSQVSDPDVDQHIYTINILYALEVGV